MRHSFSNSVPLLWLDAPPFLLCSRLIAVLVGYETETGQWDEKRAVEALAAIFKAEEQKKADAKAATAAAKKAAAAVAKEAAAVGAAAPKKGKGAAKKDAAAAKRPEPAAAGAAAPKKGKRAAAGVAALAPPPPRSVADDARAAECPNDCDCDCCDPHDPSSGGAGAAPLRKRVRSVTADARARASNATNVANATHAAVDEIARSNTTMAVRESSKKRRGPQAATPAGAVLAFTAVAATAVAGVALAAASASVARSGSPPDSAVRPAAAPVGKKAPLRITRNALDGKPVVNQTVACAHPLSNLGNTCFMSALLQCMMVQRPFTDACRDHAAQNCQ